MPPAPPTSSVPASLSLRRALLALCAVLSMVACSLGADGEGGPNDELDPSRCRFEEVAVEGLIANGTDEASFQAKVFDRSGRPAAGRKVELRSSVASDRTIHPQATDWRGGVPLRVRATEAGSRQLTLIVDGVRCSREPSVTFAPGPAVRLAFAQAPDGPVRAGEAIRPVIEVQVQDAHGNLSPSELLVSLDAVGAEAEPQEAVARGGIARFPSFAIRRTASAVRLRAAAKGLPEMRSAPFDVEPGKAVRLEFERQPPEEIRAGAPFLVTVTLRDAAGNLATTAQEPVRLTLVSLEPGVNLYGVTELPPRGGVAVFDDLQIERAGAHFQIRAQGAGMAPAYSRAFAVAAAAPSPERSLLELDVETAVTADGQQTAPFVVRIQDGYGNPVAGASLALGASGSGHVFLPAERIQTNKEGRAEAALVSQIAEAKVVTVRVDDAFDLQGAVRFVAGPPDASRSSLQIVPPAAPADGVSEVVAELHLRDASGNAVAERQIHFAASGEGVAWPAGNVATTDSDGIARLPLNSTKAEQKTVFADVGAFQLSQEVRFLPGQPSALHSDVISGEGQVGPVGSWLAEPFVVEIRDARGNPLHGALAIFELDEESQAKGAELSTTQELSDEAGRVQVFLRLGGEPGAYRVAWQAWDDAAPRWLEAEAWEPVATFEIVTGDRQRASLGQSLPLPLVVRALDDKGDGLAGRAVHFHETSGLSFLGPAETMTDEEGLAWVWVVADGPPTGPDPLWKLTVTLEEPGQPELSFELILDEDSGERCVANGESIVAWDGNTVESASAGVIRLGEYDGDEVQVELGEAVPGRKELGSVVQGVALSCSDLHGQQIAIYRAGLQEVSIHEPRGDEVAAIGVVQEDGSWLLSCPSRDLQAELHIGSAGIVNQLVLRREEGAWEGGACGGEPSAALSPLPQEESYFATFP